MSRGAVLDAPPAPPLGMEADEGRRGENPWLCVVEEASEQVKADCRFWAGRKVAWRVILRRVRRPDGWPKTIDCIAISAVGETKRAAFRRVRDLVSSSENYGSNDRADMLSAARATWTEHCL